MVQQPRQQRKNRRQRRFSFGRLFDQRGAVGGLLEVTDFLAQSRVRLAQDDLAQRVQFGATAAREAEVGKIKEVEFAAKRRFGASRAFGDRGDATEIRREPVDDEAGFGQQAGAENQALGALIFAQSGIRVGNSGDSFEREIWPEQSKKVILPFSSQYQNSNAPLSRYKRRFISISSVVLDEDQTSAQISGAIEQLNSS